MDGKQQQQTDKRREDSHTHTQQAQSAAAYLRDLLRDMVGAVDELAGRDDVHLARGEGDERVGLEIHKVEGDLRDLGDGAVPHQVRVRRGVQDVGLAVDPTCKIEVSFT